jgi:hypothetical protein
MSQNYAAPLQDFIDTFRNLKHACPTSAIELPES